MMSATVVIPGTDVSAILDQSDTTHLGGGLVRLRNGSVVCSLAGYLHASNKRCWVGEAGKRNLPMEGDVVIGTVVENLGESYSVDVGGPRLASLDALAFDGASRRNAPNLHSGALLFCRVIRSGHDVEPQITCEAPGTGKKKDWTTGETQFGELKGGCVFQVRRSTCRMLCESNNLVLVALGKQLAFEICIGLNGRIWICADDHKRVVLIASVIRATEGKRLENKSQADALVKNLLETLE